MLCTRLIPSLNLSHEQARRNYADAIEKAKKTHWEEWLENLQGEEIWIANKYMDKTSSDGAQARVPTLKRKEENGAVIEVETNEVKSHFLFKSFFSQDETQTPSPMDHSYPEPAFPFGDLNLPKTMETELDGPRSRNERRTQATTPRVRGGGGHRGATRRVQIRTAEQRQMATTLRSWLNTAPCYWTKQQLSTIPYYTTIILAMRPNLPEVNTCSLRANAEHRVGSGLHTFTLP